MDTDLEAHVSFDIRYFQGSHIIYFEIATAVLSSCADEQNKWENRDCWLIYSSLAIEWSQIFQDKEMKSCCLPTAPCWLYLHLEQKSTLLSGASRWTGRSSLLIHPNCVCYRNSFTISSPQQTKVISSQKLLNFPIISLCIVSSKCSWDSLFLHFCILLKHLQFPWLIYLHSVFLCLFRTLFFSYWGFS